MSQTILDLIDNGVVLINKPCGQSSHEITTFVKKILGAKRAGHAGTLDPQVSGVLPVALGRATKLLQYIAGKEKTYICVIKFKHPKTREEVESLFSSFRGEITQTPPKISAVRKAPRKRIIHLLSLLEMHPSGKFALFEATVDAGTYIRTLCDDIGKTCGGARMEELRRIRVGRLDEKNTYSMQDLLDATWFWKNRNDPSLLLRMIKKPDLFIELPKVHIKTSALESLLSGAQIMAPALESVPKTLRLGSRVMLYCDDTFIGIGVMVVDSKEAEKMKKGQIIKIERMHAQRK